MYLFVCVYEEAYKILVFHRFFQTFLVLVTLPAPVLCPIAPMSLFAKTYIPHHSCFPFTAPVFSLEMTMVKLTTLCRMISSRRSTALSPRWSRPSPLQSFELASTIEAELSLTTEGLFWRQIHGIQRFNIFFRRTRMSADEEVFLFFAIVVLFKNCKQNN